MKKSIYLILFIIVLITFITYGYMNVKSNKVEKENIDVIENDVDKILSVSIKEETEGGYIYYKTKDKELIEEVIKALKNIQIGEKVDIMFSDQGRYYIVEYDDGTILTYYFQGDYYNKDNVNYKTDNYDKLKEINIPKENIDNN
ncbi:MAG: hypothetical protein ACI4WU_01100 [Bacilli bacterium]